MLLLLSVFCYGPITPRHMCWWIGQAYTKDDKMIEDDLFHNLSQVGAETTPHPCRRFEDCSSTLVNFCVTSHVISPGTLFPIENDASPPPSPLPSPRDANLTHDAAPAVHGSPRPCQQVRASSFPRAGTSPTSGMRSPSPPRF